MAPVPLNLWPAEPHRGVAYRPDIDGLRAVAVCAVVFYHAGLTAFGGGFIGVDVFFVISGYLIMSVIAADIDSGRFILLDFYERRTRRILPALIVMLAFCCLAAVSFFPPNVLSDYAKSLIATIFSASNFYFRGIATIKGYFDTESQSRMLLQTWSLAVEEQFYFLLPAILIALRRIRPAATFSVLGVLAAVSLAWATYTVRFKPSYAFYIVFPRAWELLAGSLLALIALPCEVPRLLRESAAFVGLGLILAPIFLYSDRTLFPGLSALPPVVGTCLVIFAGIGQPSAAGRFLAIGPLVRIGLISYSLYLWHWPLMVITRWIVVGKVGPGIMVGVVCASFLAAAISYRFVEKPFRGRGRISRRAGVFEAAGAAVGSVGLVGALLLLNHGLPGRFSAKDRAAMAANVERVSETSELRCLNWNKTFKTMADIELCPIDPSIGSRRVLFWGDSHVAQFRPLVETLAHEGFFDHREIAFATAGGCPPARGINHVADPYHCPDFAEYAWQLAQDSKVDFVFLGFSAGYEQGKAKICEVSADGSCGRMLSGEEVAERIADEVRNLGRRLRERHVGFVVMLPGPTYDVSIPEVELKLLSIRRLSPLLGRYETGRSLGRSDYNLSRSIVARAAQDVGATLFDPRTVLCREPDECIYQRHDVSIYADGTHIASSQVGLFRGAMMQAFRRVMAELP